ncbi:cobalt-precorrin-5B (C(1))-methyltransferase [Rhizobium paknamense]|uniref:Cobalt-precorrin-5B C(1)-methyltransferase n=1 Tax=Rhizobium paknamense TaxID=1206817 RepID=A0ABU0I6E0_9HYPH|nr:cobalt-precorrin-5B (C(1))-methyltransferase [Rhizobium paknamense]MDQ0453778.1 cobalt-precorrin-5B (C1)-methyltransferase [Rhizobium paknamense]
MTKDVASGEGTEGAARKPGGVLRTGWTTGACATAAAKAAYTALLTGTFPDPVSIRLPKGQEPAFALAVERLEAGAAMAGIIKDAGDDPDVTHGATVIATIRLGPTGAGIRFFAGEGVGTVTRPGLPLAIGEPAINPVPRQMMMAELQAVALAKGVPADIDVTLSIPGGAEIAQKTWNPRLGIVGGLSILGTTGIVHPFSCAAWIHSIHRGVDVARAMGLSHVLGATGSTSEQAAQAFHALPAEALLDMGDFAGGLLKYLRQHPVERLTLAGGFAKMAKLAQGALDLHSSRSQIDNRFLASLIPDRSPELAERVLAANTALDALELARERGIDLASPVAQLARQTALDTLKGAPVAVEVMVIDRKGNILARSP